MNPRSKLDTGYYGADGGIASIAPIFSCGAQPLAPSFLTGNGSHMVLWTSVVIHVIALVLNLAANCIFFVNSGETASDMFMGWAVASLVMHTLGVVGTVVSTGFIKDCFATPLINTLGIGLFLGGLLATAKISYTQGVAKPSDSGDTVTFNLSLFFQAFGMASLVSNALCALSTK